MFDWKKELAVSKLSPSEFVTKYYNEIEGPNRDAKLKRVKRILGKLNRSTRTEEPKREIIYENLYNPTTLNLNSTAKQITFGLISDTHFNSKYCQITYLNQYYDLCKELGIKDIYHAGDIDDGENMRPGHVYENYTQGADDHIIEIIKNYPMREGITTHFITGNHDAAFRKHCGLDIGYQLASRRLDFDYLGRDLAVINFTPKVSMMLKHPWSGSSYALSYRPQKIVEAMETSMEKKPTILAIGHFHKFEYLFYHGIHCFQTGCFQSATPFTIGKGISVAMGGWIITLDLDSEGNLLSITPKAVTFIDPVVEDYKNYNR